MKMRARRHILANLRQRRPKTTLVVYNETRDRSISDFFREWIDHLRGDKAEISVKPGKPLTDIELDRGWSPEVVFEISFKGPDLKETSCLKNSSATS